MNCSIILMIGPAGTNFRLSYKTSEAREQAIRHAFDKDNSVWRIADDYGQIVDTTPNSVHAVIMTSDDAEIEITLNQHRAQAEAQKRALNDPEIKAAEQRARLRQQSPLFSGAA